VTSHNSQQLHSELVVTSNMRSGRKSRMLGPTLCLAVWLLTAICPSLAQSGCHNIGNELYVYSPRSFEIMTDLQAVIVSALALMDLQRPYLRSMVVQRVQQLRRCK